MSAIEPSARSASRPHITVARHGAAERHRHLSAVLEQIRDDGPALDIGPVPVAADNPPAESPAVAAAANDAKGSAAALDAIPAMQASPSPRYPWAVCLLFAVALAGCIGYSVWLHMRIGALEAQMLSLADGQEQR